MWCRYELWVNALEEQCLYRLLGRHNLSNRSQRSRLGKPGTVLGTGSIDSWPIQPSTVVGEPRSSHEDTTNPSEHERQVAEVGREDTSSECVKPCVVGSEVMAVSVKSPDPVGVSDLGCGNSTDPRPVGE